MSKAELMISSKVVEALGSTRYKWVIKLEAKGVPNCFLLTKPFEGTLDEANKEGQRLVRGAIDVIGRVVLERGKEVKDGLSKS